MTEAKKPGGPCPCGSRKAYALCCWRWHSGEVAPDAEALMRSRYAAYVMKRLDYILATWHASTRPASADLTDLPRWLGLKVLRHEKCAWVLLAIRRERALLPVPGGPKKMTEPSLSNSMALRRSFPGESKWL